jgi:hypothetical protein
VAVTSNFRPPIVAVPFIWMVRCGAKGGLTSDALHVSRMDPLSTPVNSCVVTSQSRRSNGKLRTPWE